MKKQRNIIIGITAFACLCMGIVDAFIQPGYHVAMMIGWFGLPVVLLALVGLFAGGVIFSFFNEKYNNIYLSWLIHMCANFATNTIGYILFNK